MKVIGAGLPRTATLSQKVALEKLGFGPCYHMVNLLGNLESASDWRRALAGERDWDKLFEGFESMVDWPGSFFYADLMEVYPEAKVILSVRDGESWARSMRDTIWGVHYGDLVIRHLSDARTVIDSKWAEYIRLMKEMWQRMEMAGNETSEEEMVTGMDRYHQEVRERVPSDRLLVWSVTDGWEPICEFLGVPVPDGPFPHLNDSKMFTERVLDGSLKLLQEWRAAQEEKAPAEAAPSAGGAAHN